MPPNGYPKTVPARPPAIASAVELPTPTVTSPLADDDLTVAPTATAPTRPPATTPSPPVTAADEELLTIRASGPISPPTRPPIAGAALAAPRDPPVTVPDEVAFATTPFRTPTSAPAIMPLAAVT